MIELAYRPVETSASQVQLNLWNAGSLYSRMCSDFYISLLYQSSANSSEYLTRFGKNRISRVMGLPTLRPWYSTSTYRSCLGWSLRIYDSRLLSLLSISWVCSSTTMTDSECGFENYWDFELIWWLSYIPGMKSWEDLLFLFMLLRW